MKTKKYLHLFIALSSLCYLNNMALSSINKYIEPEGDPNKDLEARASKFHKTTIKNIKELFNKPDAAILLSHDLQPIEAFLELSDELSMSLEIVCEYLTLFFNKLKSCKSIKSTAIEKLIQNLPFYLEEYFFLKPIDTDKAYENLKKKIKIILSSNISNYLSDSGKFSESSLNTFVTETTPTIFREIEKVRNQYNRKNTTLKLQLIIIQMVDLIINKINWIWDNESSLLKTFLVLGYGIESIKLNGITKKYEDIDNIIWSLVFQFNTLLNSSKHNFSRSFYQNLQNLIKNQKISFLDRQEFTEGIKTKKEILLETIEKKLFLNNDQNPNQ